MTRATIPKTGTRPFVAVGYGTRPQVIKVARLLPALRERWDTLTIDTGQHYDYELNALLYDQLQVPRPDVLLGVGSAPRDEQLALIERACGAVLRQRRPAAMVVIGDTNSTLACARAARDAGIPVVHVEAGLRSDVAAMAEEMNRVEVDRLSAMLCAPSRLAMAALEREGLAGRACRTGDVALDALRFALSRGLRAPREWPLAGGDAYAFATLHRAELTDDPRLLSIAIEALAALPLPVVLALHPRTRGRLAALGLQGPGRGSLHCVTALGYLEALAAVQGASVVVTDSGGVQREAYWMGIPCVTLRRETEWVETVSLGANRLVDPGRAATELPAAVEAMQAAPRAWDRGSYGSGDAALMMANAMADLPALRYPLSPA